MNKGVMVETPRTIGRYEVIERVGRGGMGVLYRGRDPVLDREVAIKVMAGDFSTDESARSRFFREARASARVSSLRARRDEPAGRRRQDRVVVVRVYRLEQAIQQLAADRCGRRPGDEPQNPVHHDIMSATGQCRQPIESSAG